MTTCREMRLDISAYCDDELDPARREAVTAHLAGCAECAAYHRRLMRLGELIGAGRSWEPPESVWSGITATVPGVRPRRRFGPWCARAAALAAGFLFYLLGYRAVAPPAAPQDPRRSVETVQIDEALRDTGLVLASSPVLGELSPFLEEMPETLLLSELIEERVP